MLGAGAGVGVAGLAEGLVDRRQASLDGRWRDPVRVDEGGVLEQGALIKLLSLVEKPPGEYYPRLPVRHSDHPP
jgi:hypothetical protein